MENLGALIDLVLKAVALAMGVATVVLGALDAAPIAHPNILLGIGLFALALAALRAHPEEKGA